MPSRPPSHRSAGWRPPEQARRERNGAHDVQRRRDAPWRAWYGLRAWALAREAQLARAPLCERHGARGEIVPATVVNHRRPHRGEWALFIDPANHESVCKPCHDREIQREERASSIGGSRSRSGV
ncbi:MAG: HNH endonuclease [Methylobacterium sp.]|uniref:HNH endonuclease n=1 Tax=Methylobacterium sp. TaxID=409 RepID=UPI002588ECF6|nr:HNH endonuclease [Methylobacterium sp.]MBY0299809.1 HNH endonuclease [Methylobacterium sp.]